MQRSAGRSLVSGTQRLAAVKDHDFADPQLGKVIPYGIYDLAANAGWVNVGTDHDTAAFAVESIRRWWNGAGRDRYPAAGRLLITADAGGPTATGPARGKTELAAFARDSGLEITCCHFPPGTSKWNKIEHRLFSAITINWRGRPLTSHQVIVNSIAATTTSTGLRVHAELDPASYPANIKISDAQMDSLPLHRHGWHGDWNYTLPPAPPAQPLPPPPPARQPERTHWAHPALTGLTDNGWNQLITLLTSPARHPHRGHPPALTLAEQVLATVLRQRFATPQPVRAELFGVVTGTIAKAQRHTTPCSASTTASSAPDPAPSKPSPTSPATPRATTSTSPQNPKQRVKNLRALAGHRPRTSQHVAPLSAQQWPDPGPSLPHGP